MNTDSLGGRHHHGERDFVSVATGTFQKHGVRAVAQMAALAVVFATVTRPANAEDPIANRYDSPPSPVNNVRLDQRLNEQIPLDVKVFDESGNALKLADIADRRPVVLVPAYYRCPMLCTQVISAMVDTIAVMDLRPGTDFQVIVFSIDPREKPSLAAEKRLNYLRRFGRNDTQPGWHFLTAPQESVDKLCEALGYHYVYDPHSDQFAHPAAVAILTPKGRIARYLLDFSYKPRDLRLALVEASQGKIGNVIDQVLLRCFHYDPATGKYGFAIMTAIRVGGTVTVVALMATVLLLRHRGRWVKKEMSAEPQ